MRTQDDQPRSRRLPAIDSGWIFLACGLALLVAVVLIPTQRELVEARDRRDDTLALEEARLEEIDRAERVLGALERGEERLYRSLGASQLGVLGADRADLAPDVLGVPTDAALLDSLTPRVRLPERVLRPVSTLERLATEPSLRLWLIAAAAILLMLGLYPPGARSPSGRRGSQRSSPTIGRA